MAFQLKPVHPQMCVSSFAQDCDSELHQMTSVNLT